MGPSFVCRVTRPFLLLGSREPASYLRLGADVVGVPGSTRDGVRIGVGRGSSRTRHFGMGITRGPIEVPIEVPNVVPFGPLSSMMFEGDPVVWDTVEDCRSSLVSSGSGPRLLPLSGDT